MQEDARLAAVDLGSNSFRLEIGRLTSGRLERVDYLKETVRQGRGLGPDQRLGAEAMQRGWDCLARFGERLRGFDVRHVRAVATQTLREARNRDDFLGPAQDRLGFPIEVVTGEDEARLIYRGVAEGLPDAQEARLVVDIGGRSTEIILGRGLQPQTLGSYPVGSVSWSDRHFPDGRVTAAALGAAEDAAMAVLASARALVAPASWQAVYGCSGTVGAAADLLAAAGWPAGRITREGLNNFTERLLSAGSVDALQVEGLQDGQRAVLAGGLAVLRAVFASFDVQVMHRSKSALRHGLLHELAQRASASTRMDC